MNDIAPASNRDVLGGTMIAGGDCRVGSMAPIPSSMPIMAVTTTVADNEIRRKNGVRFVDMGRELILKQQRMSAVYLKMRGLQLPCPAVRPPVKFS